MIGAAIAQFCISKLLLEHFTFKKRKEILKVHVISVIFDIKQRHHAYQLTKELVKHLRNTKFY